MAKRVKVTDELLQQLNLAQQKHTAELLASPYNRFGDDWGDDTNAALTLSRTLFEMVWDQSCVDDLDVWLNTPYDESKATITLPTLGPVDQLKECGGCDGYAPELD
jgi:hypothetical protein